MDLSALERKVKALETSLDSVETWLTVSTVAVIIGLVLEYWHDVVELVDAIKLRSRRPLFFNFSSPFPWKKLQAMAGGALVTVGVAGELWFQSRASNIQTFIRSDSHQIEALLDGKAADADKEAAIARKEAKALEKANLLLQADVIKLQEAARWRDFSKSQADELVTLTHKYMVRPEPNFTVSFDSVVGNPEAKRYGDQISSALSSALRIKIEPPPGLSGCVQCSGVWVCVDDNAKPELMSDGRAIRDLLAHVGVKAAKFCTDPRDSKG